MKFRLVENIDTVEDPKAVTTSTDKNNKKELSKDTSEEDVEKIKQEIKAIVVDK